MTLESIITIGATIIAVISAPFIYMWKNMESRITQVEARIEDMVTRDSLKGILQDKLEPIKEDLVETKLLLSKILDLELKRSGEK